jgi:hypothetical protein
MQSLTYTIDIDRRKETFILIDSTGNLTSSPNDE